MLEYMKLSQLAAFYLGIALTVISLATTLLALKYAKKLNSFAKAISLCLIVPFLACTSWLYLVFSYLDGLRKSEILTLFVAILLSLFICAMVVIVSKALYSKHGPALEDYDRYMEALAENGGEEIASETTEEVAENEENTETALTTVAAVAAAPLLLEGENEETIIVEAEEAEEVEETETEEVEEEAAEEKTEVFEDEDDSETLADVEETETPADETEESVETEEETTPESETEEYTENEDVEETEIEEVEEEADDKTSDGDDNDDNSDEEFNKFLEELRRKVETNNTDTDNGENN